MVYSSSYPLLALEVIEGGIIFFLYTCVLSFRQGYPEDYYSKSGWSDYYPGYYPNSYDYGGKVSKYILNFSVEK